MSTCSHELWPVAIHEAGHAVAAIVERNYYPRIFFPATKRAPDSKMRAGLKEVLTPCVEDKEYLQQVCIMAAGSVAEQILLKSASNGFAGDLSKIRLVQGFVSDSKVQVVISNEIRDNYPTAQKVVRSNARAVRRIAAQVIKNIHDGGIQPDPQKDVTILSSDSIKEIYEKASRTKLRLAIFKR